MATATIYNLDMHKLRLQIALAFAITVAFSAVVQADPSSSSEKVLFEQDVLPILKDRCFSCHSHEAGKAGGGLVLDSRVGWEKGGGSGPAVIPGKPNDSLLIQAIEFDGLEMPPGKRLPGQEIETLRTWVINGAPDPRAAMSPKTDPKTLWALQPIRKYAPPRIKNKKWPNDDLDQFILSSLEKVKLQPNDSADRYTLLRRLTYDITGLPPTPDEIKAFLLDDTESAYRTVVDRLLDSDAFGDHWARHWFDLSCYADLGDINGNMLIRDAWRYRDYVIASLNADKPLDLFITEQLAGDLLPFDSVEQQREQIIATGYLAIGPWTLQNYIKKQLDADVVDHQIDRIGKTFLGQTISCARCHDHKFDPIPTRDYYALAGIFHSTATTSYDGPGVWSQVVHRELPQPELKPEAIKHIEQQLRTLREQHEQLQLQLSNLLLSLPEATDANRLMMVEAVQANNSNMEYTITFDAGPSVWANASQATAASDGIRIDLIRSDNTIYKSFSHKPGVWTGDKDAQALKPVSVSYVGDGTGALSVRISAISPGNGRFGGAIDNLTIRQGDTDLFTESFDFNTDTPIKGKQAHTGLTIYAKATLPRWTGTGINHSHAVEHGAGDLALQLFGGSTINLAAAKPVTDTEVANHKRANEIRKELDSLNRKISELSSSETPDVALAVHDVTEPANSRIYIRGEFDSLGKEVPRGFLTAFDTTVSNEITGDSSGRLQLAHWITAPDNPLTSRVLANRIWQKLFGEGIVRTVDYFGVHGEVPSHPKLLDYLARRLAVDNRWSLKETIRQLVLSSTYKISSSHNAVSSIVDPDNRLWWRMPRRRLSAESIRDSMLAISGELNPARGGSPLGLELPGNIRGLGGNVNPPTWAGQIADYIMNRRTIYMPVRRARPTGDLEVLSVFDFPHPSEITGLRPQTTVATQALFLLNSPFVKHQSVMLAKRVREEFPDQEQNRVNHLYLLTTGQPATEDDITDTLAFLDACSKDFESGAVNPAQARLMAWEQLCHGMLASNRFLFRE